VLNFIMSMVYEVSLNVVVSFQTLYLQLNVVIWLDLIINLTELWLLLLHLEFLEILRELFFQLVLAH